LVPPGPGAKAPLEAFRRTAAVRRNAATHTREKSEDDYEGLCSFPAFPVMTALTALLMPLGAADKYLERIEN
jgi:hypothetical protein